MLTLTHAGYGIVAAGMPRMATRQTLDGEPGASNGAVMQNRSPSILRATRMESTAGSQYRTKHDLVDA